MEALVQRVQWEEKERQGFQDLKALKEPQVPEEMLDILEYQGKRAGLVSKATRVPKEHLVVRD